MYFCRLAATIGADIVKQKMAENNGGYKAVNFGYTDDRVYSKLTSENPIDLVRYQLANCYMGRAGLINSGGAAGGGRAVNQSRSFWVSVSSSTRLSTWAGCLSGVISTPA